MPATIFFCSSAMTRVVFWFSTKSKTVLIGKDVNDEGLVGPRNIFKPEDFIFRKFFCFVFPTISMRLVCVEFKGNSEKSQALEIFITKQKSSPRLSRNYEDAACSLSEAHDCRFFRAKNAVIATDDNCS